VRNHLLRDLNELMSELQVMEKVHLGAKGRRAIREIALVDYCGGGRVNRRGSHSKWCGGGYL
jgi:hypothetical protein